MPTEIGVVRREQVESYIAQRRDKAAPAPQSARLTLRGREIRSSRSHGDGRSTLERHRSSALETAKMRRHVGDALRGRRLVGKVRTR